MYNIEYFDGNTLIHGATESRMTRYAKLLVHYNFDIKKPSSQSNQRSYTVSVQYPSKLREFYDSRLVKFIFYYTIPPNKIHSFYHISQS